MKNLKVCFMVLCFAITIVYPKAEAGGRGSGRHSGGGHRSSYSSHSSYRSSPHKSSSNHSRRSYTSKSSYRVSAPKHNKSYTIGVKRDAHGKIARSSRAKNEFKKSHPCPSTGKSSGSCKGYVIDHVRALKHGGADAPSNMQWQTKEAAKIKDKTE